MPSIGRSTFLHCKIILLLLFIFFTFINGNVLADGASIDGHVADEITQEPIMNATVTLSYSDNGTFVTQTLTDTAGNFYFSNLSLDKYTIDVDAVEYLNKSIEIELAENRTYELDIYLEQEAMEAALSSPVLCFQMVIILTIVLILSIIMYSLLKRENLLKNATRKRIYDYLHEYPGKHYRAIQNDLDLSLGVLSHHLDKLERGQYITSRQDGKYKRYYIRGSENETFYHITSVQESILDVIKENQGISQSMIAQKLGISRKVVNYHVNILNQSGLIILKRKGRETACYVDRLKSGKVVVT
jgi:predicted transcriptional regulator